LPEASPLEEQSSNVWNLKEDLDRHRRVRSFGSFLLALYVFIGVLVILFTHGLWCESMTELGKPPSYLFHVRDAFILWTYAFPSFLIIFVVTDDARTHASIAKVIMRITGKKTSNEYTIPNITALLNTVILSLTYFSFLVGISGLMNAFSISFTVVNAGIVSIATFYYIVPPAWEIMKAEDGRARFEALKLEHDANMSLGNNVIWAMIILIASVVFISWTQLICPTVDPTLWYTMAFVNLQALTVAQLAYLAVGIWFGILTRLWDNAWRIRKEIVKLKFAEKV
jgi:hypothetical protein